MPRKRIKSVTTKTLPDNEELEFFNSRTRENRAKHAAQQLLDNYRRLFAAVCQHMQEEEAASQAEEQRLRKRKRIYRRQMRTLANRVLLCVAIVIGVCMSWWFELVTLEFFLGVFFLCSCIIAFACGSGREKERQFGGEKR
jgi:hypothetical protein